MLCGGRVWKVWCGGVGRVLCGGRVWSVWLRRSGEGVWLRSEEGVGLRRSGEGDVRMRSGGGVVGSRSEEVL